MRHLEMIEMEVAVIRGAVAERNFATIESLKLSLLSQLLLSEAR